jgi:hypothetical protein
MNTTDDIHYIVDPKDCQSEVCESGGKRSVAVIYVRYGNLFIAGFCKECSAELIVGGKNIGWDIGVVKYDPKEIV